MSERNESYRDDVPRECIACGCDSYSDTDFLDGRPYFGRDFDCGNTFWAKDRCWSDTCTCCSRCKGCLVHEPEPEPEPEPTPEPTGQLAEASEQAEPTNTCPTCKGTRLVESRDDDDAHGPSSCPDCKGAGTAAQAEPEPEPEPAPIDETEITGDDPAQYAGCAGRDTTLAGCVWVGVVAVGVIGLILAFIGIMRQIGWPEGW